jgi:hypothetical protein
MKDSPLRYRPDKATFIDFDDGAEEGVAVSTAAWSVRAFLQAEIISLPTSGRTAS